MFNLFPFVIYCSHLYILPYGCGGGAVSISALYLREGWGCKYINVPRISAAGLSLKALCIPFDICK